MKGSAFIARIAAATPKQRHAATLDAVERNELVRWPMIPIRAGRTTFFAASDYFSIGEPDDFVRMPLDGLSASRTLRKLGQLHPTRKMVDLIWSTARNEGTAVVPLPWGPPYDASMLSVERIAKHNARIEDALPATHVNGELIAGHKKDVVLSNRLLVGPRVPRDKLGQIIQPATIKDLAIYGWHRLNGIPIQPLNTTTHEIGYDDYSHGIREIASECDVDGRSRMLIDVLGDPELCGELSDEGPLHVLSYEPELNTHPTEPALTIPSAIVRGETGPVVGKWQALQQSEPKPPDWPAQWTWPIAVDNKFGPRTERATQAWQRRRGLVVTGGVSAANWARALGEHDEPTVVDLSVPDELPKLRDPLPFVPAHFFTKGPRTQPIELIVIHTMEAAEKPNTAEAVAAYFKAGCPDANGTMRPASAHFCVDANSVVQSVKVEDIAYHAPGTNGIGIGIEHAGYAGQKPADWADPFSVAMLRLSAVLAAQLSSELDIPVEWVDAEGLLAGKSGFTTHAAATQASRLANARGLTTSRYYNRKNPTKPLTDHTDPGPNFPADFYLALVRRAQQG